MAQTRWLLSGPGRDVALDRLFVHAEVLGVAERAEGYEVWIDGDRPDGVDLPEARLDPLPITPDLFGRTGREGDTAVLVADDLCVRPPWVASPAGFRGIELVVPRGGAFGSGEHGSTRAALTVLHAVWPRDGVPTLCDVGTGSGILAGYGAARGVLHIAACDVEFDACRAARDLVPGLRVVCGGPEVMVARHALVVANMNDAELAAAAPALVRSVAAGGLLVLSGMRAATGESEMTSTLAAAGFSPSGPRVECEGYVARAFRSGATVRA